MAEPRSLHLDEHFAGARSFEVERLDPERLAFGIRTRQALLVQDGTSDFHVSRILPVWLGRTLAQPAHLREAWWRTAAMRRMR